MFGFSVSGGCRRFWLLLDGDVAAVHVAHLRIDRRLVDIALRNEFRGHTDERQGLADRGRTKSAHRLGFDHGRAIRKTGSARAAGHDDPLDLGIHDGAAHHLDIRLVEKIEIRAIEIEKHREGGVALQRRRSWHGPTIGRQHVRREIED